MGLLVIGDRTEPGFYGERPLAAPWRSAAFAPEEAIGKDSEHADVDFPGTGLLHVLVGQAELLQQGRIGAVPVGDRKFGHFVDPAQAHHQFDFEFFAVRKLTLARILTIARQAVLVDAEGQPRGPSGFLSVRCSSASSSAAGGTPTSFSAPATGRFFAHLDQLFDRGRGVEVGAHRLDLHAVEGSASSFVGDVSHGAGDVESFGRFDARHRVAFAPFFQPGIAGLDIVSWKLALWRFSSSLSS